MSIDPTSQSAIAALAEFDSAYNETTADNGEGARGEWPPSGDHVCQITEIAVRPFVRKGKDKKAGGAAYEHPGVNVQFFYTCTNVVPGQKDPSEPLKWKGTPMFVPSKPSLIPESLSWLKEIDASRLKGFLTAINGASSNSITADLTSAMNRVHAQGSRVLAVIRAQQRERPNPNNPAKPYVDFTDFCVEVTAR